MPSNIYVAISGQRALLKRLESIAQNVANLGTPGYRADRISFQEIVDRASDTATSFVSEGRTYLSTQSGALEKTGNPLDLAISGNAWFAIATPSGLAYTRDGRMSMTPTGQLMSMQGHPFVDVGGSPLQIDPNGSPPTIGKDGSISQGAQVLGRIGLFDIDSDASLRRNGNGGVVLDRAAEPHLDFNSVSIAQGFIEKSNSEPILEMTRLISLQRNFDAVSNAVSEAEEGLTNAIRTLGG